MEWLKLTKAQISSMDWRRLPLVVRGTWTSLMGFCMAEENGGRIDATGWEDSDWLQAIGATREDVEMVVKRGRARWDGDALEVLGYDQDGQRISAAASDRARKAALARWGIDARSTAPSTAPSNAPSIHEDAPSTAPSNARTEGTDGRKGDLPGNAPSTAPGNAPSMQPEPRRFIHRVGGKTAAFMRVLAAYPNKSDDNEAASRFQEEADQWAGGEEALAQAILAALSWQLSTPEFKNEPTYIQKLKHYIANRRWLDSRPAEATDRRPFGELGYPMVNAKGQVVNGPGRGTP